MQTSLSPGDHLYSDILEGIRLGQYEFARASTLSGHEVPIIGISPAQMQDLRAIVTRIGLTIVLYGSRVAGTRVHQRTLSPVLAQGLTLECTARHPSIGTKGIRDVRIRKDVIKEYGRDDPLTSDLSIAVTSGMCESAREKALALELELNRQLRVTFHLRAFLSLHGQTFRAVQDFIDFGRERYIKKDLPAGHGFSNAEIDDAFMRTIVVIEPGTPP